MLFLYDLPNGLLGLGIIATLMALTHICYFVFRRLSGGEFTDNDRSVALTILGIVATVNSLLLAFSAVSVWESFGAADEAVVEEANTIGALARDLAVFDSAESRQIRQMLRDYTNMVVTTEWRDMQRGQASLSVWNQFDRMFLTIGTIEPDTPRRIALLPEILARTNELLKQRRSRLYTSESEVPGTLWAVVLVGTLLTVVTAFVPPPTRFNLWMISALAFSIGLVFYFIVAMDRPFAGQESIRPGPFESALINMERWDTEIAAHAPAR